MPGVYPDLHAEKSSIVKELFISTADDNYVLARWCFQKNLNVDFFWLAVHALEKYFKAVLLMNGRSSKSLGHEVVQLYHAVQPLAPELLIARFDKPTFVPASMWRDETAPDFLARLYQDGNANNRYLIYGFVQSPEDLFKLDQIVFSVRRLAQALDVRYVGDEENDDLPKYSRRHALALRPKRHENLQSNLEEIMEGKRGVELQNILLNCNYPFAGDDYPHEQSPFQFASQNPILMTRLYETLDAGTSHFADGDRLWEWVLENIQLPRGLPDKIEQERARRKAATIADGRE